MVENALMDLDGAWVWKSYLLAREPVWTDCMAARIL